MNRVLATSILNLSFLIPISSPPQRLSNNRILLTHSLESLLGLILLSLLTSHTALSHFITSLPSLPSLPNMPHVSLPHIPYITSPAHLHSNTISLTRFPPTSPWKTLKSRSSSFKSRSSKYSHNSNPMGLDASESTIMQDEMMIYVTVLEDRRVDPRGHGKGA